MTRPTLKDVADRVGVSAKTVSNVVNDTGWVTDDLRRRVREALAEVGYRPNAAARQLRSGRSGMITLALPDLSQPYFAELAAEVVRAAQERAITVLVNQTDGREDAERRISDGLGVPAMDGLIISPLALRAADLQHRLDTTPMVLLGEHLVDSVYPQVTVDNTAAARDATAHLLARGCRRIAALGAQERGPNETALLRLDGYRAALERGGVPFDPDLVVEVEDYRRADGAAAAERLLASGVPFDGVFAFNDLLALGAMHVLVSRGVAVPDDVAVIGFDDIDESRYSSPSLSSVAPDVPALARTALDLLFDTDRSGGVALVDHAVVARASTGGEAA